MKLVFMLSRLACERKCAWCGLLAGCGGKVLQQNVTHSKGALIDAFIILLISYLMIYFLKHSIETHLWSWLVLRIICQSECLSCLSQCQLCLAVQALSCPTVGTSFLADSKVRPLSFLPFSFLMWLCCGECRNIWSMHVCLCWAFQGTEELSTNGPTEDDFGEHGRLPVVSHPWVPLALGAHVCKSQLNKEIIWDQFAAFFKLCFLKLCHGDMGMTIDHSVPDVGLLRERIT